MKHVCPECKAPFLSSRLLGLHRWQHHGIQGKHRARNARQRHKEKTALARTTHVHRVEPAPPPEHELLYCPHCKAPIAKYQMLHRLADLPDHVLEQIIQAAQRIHSITRTK